MPTQQALDAIRQHAKDGKYGSDAGVIKPEIVVDDDSAQVMSIPNAEGTAREAYRRKPGDEWEPVPSVGEQCEFE